MESDSLIMKWFSFLILIPFFSIFVFLFLNYKFPNGEYSFWMMIIVILIALAICIIFSFSNFSFWGKIGLILLVLLIIMPIYLCSYKIQEDKNPELFQDKFQEVNISGKFSFLNPALNTFKLASDKVANKATDIFGGLFSRLVGMRTLNGNLRCTYFFNYLLVGAMVAFWIFLLFIFSDSLSDLSSGGGVGSGSDFHLGILDRFNDFIVGASYPEGYKKIWIEKIGDHWMKVVGIALIYTYIMSFIPAVNQVLRIITLEIFMPNWFIQSLIITFELALGPMWIAQYRGYKKRKEVLKKKLAGKVYEKATEAWFKEKSMPKLSDFAGP